MVLCCLFFNSDIPNTSVCDFLALLQLLQEWLVYVVASHAWLQFCQNGVHRWPLDVIDGTLWLPFDMTW